MVINPLNFMLGEKLKDSSVASLFQNDITKTLVVIPLLPVILSAAKNLKASQIHRELLFYVGFT